MESVVHTNILTKGCSTQIYRVADCTQLEHFLSQPAEAIVIKSGLEGVLRESRGPYLHQRKLRLSHLAQDAGNHMIQVQQK